MLYFRLSPPLLDDVADLLTFPLLEAVEEPDGVFAILPEEGTFFLFPGTIDLPLVELETPAGTGTVVVVGDDKSAVLSSLLSLVFASRISLAFFSKTRFGLMLSSTLESCLV